MHKTPTILLLAIGNPIRSDDGVAAYIGGRLEALQLPGVEVQYVHQLHTDLLETLLAVDHVIIVDAAVSGAGVEFYRLEAKEQQPVASSHHVSADVLLALAGQLYQRELSMIICSVRGTNFDMGDQLSASAKANADKAVDIILQWITQINP